MARNDVKAELEVGEQLWEEAILEFFAALQGCVDGLLLDGYSQGFRQQAPRVVDSSIRPSPGAVERIAWRKTQWRSGSA